MKKIVLGAVVLSLAAACGQEAAEEPAADEVATEEVAVTDANGETMEAYLGSWDVVYADGSTGVTTNNADGTYTGEMADGTALSGTWTFGAEESCWQATDSEEATCYTVGAGDENGTRVLTMADGTSISVTPKAEETAE